MAFRSSFGENQWRLLVYPGNKAKLLFRLSKMSIHQAKVYLYLDRDSAGRKIQNDFRQQLGVTIIDKSELYDGYKDFNQFLVQAT
jgi:hypothetical protein